MSKWKYGGSAEIRLAVKDGEIFIEFCDAETWQWRHSMGVASIYESLDDLKTWVRDAVESDTDSLSDSLAEDLWNNVLKGDAE